MENEKKTIIRYLNLVSDELLNLREKANDLDDQIQEKLKELDNLTLERSALSKKIIKNHESIHRMIDYAAEEGYEIIWEGFKVVDIVEKEGKENEKN